MMQILRDAFHRFGYQPIETPSFENLETLMGKYGEEGDRLIFRILRSGDFASKVSKEEWEKRDTLSLSSSITDKALRYDLTVPFARFVVQHQNELAFPFKRYQMQPVWRADRPQKGRFREFYQCDADVVGSDSLWQEVELIQLYDEVFTRLGLSTSIRINNRKVLAGLAEVIGQPDKLIDLTIALDKLDKIGKEGVVNEWKERGLTDNSIEKLIPLLDVQGSDTDQLAFLGRLFHDNEIGKKGIEEISFVLENIRELGLKTSELHIDLTLARGLNYYTGAIFEVEAKGVEMGSVGGGGRYDDLTGIFGLKNMSGVGISFGLDRIYLCLEELDLFPKDSMTSSRVLFANFGDEEARYATRLINTLRSEGIASELYPDKAKMKKQFDYAEKKGIPFMALAGSEEMTHGMTVLKDLASGEQRSLEPDELLEVLRSGAFPENV